MSNNTIILDLINSADANKFSDEDLAHPDEFKTATLWIEDSISRAEAEKDKPVGSKTRIHDTITVFGTRGSGKTSFLLSILERFKASGSRVAVIDIIDPTLIEDKGHIFLYLISIIKELVEKEQGTVHFDPQTPDYQKRANWRNLILSLSKGIPSMDGIGADLHANPWQDPEYIMEKGLSAVTSARKLETTFNTIVAEGLKILNKSAFIIAFDDIDIDYKKGWPVLETIRKYLTSGQIITLISGDIKLFSLVIRKQQWLNLGSDFLKNEADEKIKKRDVTDSVTEMEMQYLLKVMKPERRIHLRTLGEKLMSPGNGGVSIKCRNGDKIPIVKFYENIFKEFGIHNNYQAEVYRTFFLSSPLRLQLRFLSVFDIKPGTVFGDNYKDVLLSYLLDKSIDINLATSAPKFLNIAILRLLIQEQVISEHYQLQPSTTDNSLNGSLTLLSFLFSRSTAENPDIIFDYLIKVGYTRNLQSLLGYTAKGENISQTTPSVEGLCKHAGVLKDQVLKDTIGLMLAYMGAYFNVNSGERSWAGTVTLNAFAETRKQSKESVADRFDIVVNGEPLLSKTYLAYYPLTISKNTYKQATSINYSVYTILATVGEIIRKVNNDDIDRGLLELYQVRTYPMPDFVKGIESRPENDIESNESEETDTDKTDDLDNLRSTIDSWVKKFPKSAVSPHFLGKISTRIYYALDAIHEGRQRFFLGQAMHVRIVTMLNSILIEEIKEKIKNFAGLYINNTRYSDRFFIANLTKATETNANEILDFSKWMLSCPLFIVYLNPDSSELIALLKKFAGAAEVTAGTELSVYKLLEGVSTKYGEQPNIEKDSNKFEVKIKRLAEAGIPREAFIINNPAFMENEEIQEKFSAKFGKRMAALNKLKEYVNNQQ
jgi:hypothetical protein